MQKPPFAFEEFLRSQDLKEWPSCISLDEPYSLVDKLQKDYSFNAMCKYLCEHVPLNVSLLSDLEERINTCITELEKHAEKILQCGPAYLEEHLTAFEQNIATERIGAEEVLTQTSEMGKAKVAKYSVEESKGRNVESCNYPGFKLKQLSELPRHLEAPKLWDLVIKAQHFQPNQEDQDHLFDRIADFVAHFLLVPRDAKDAFFQVYPDCLSQVVYVAFYEAFAESIKSFDDDFNNGLVDLIFQWIAGLKPRKCVWKKWNLKSFKAATVNHTSKDTTANLQASVSASSTAAMYNWLDKIGIFIASLQEE
ncbi:protein FAM227B [Gymnogyps californianus]|uniref:protein FAM227B n=1 Tax=Gymnogyps californianus TaxID=33616 RepID=UPI0021C84CF4|nr:protein FAM227B [Gymnogyps californianus]